MRKLAHSRWTGLLAAGVGLLLMGYGIYRGEVNVVFMKAVNICMECIGIG